MQSTKEEEEEEEGNHEKSLEKHEEKLTEEDLANPEPMQVKISFDPWDNTNVKALFLPDSDDKIK